MAFSICIPNPRNDFDRFYVKFHEYIVGEGKNSYNIVFKTM